MGGPRHWHGHLGQPLPREPDGLALLPLINKARLVSAKQASFVLWYEAGGAPGGIEQFDAFYRKVRFAFNKLLAGEFVTKMPGTRGYLLNTDFLSSHLGG